MRSINEFLVKKHLNNVCPNDKDELIEIIKDTLDKGITDLNFIDTSNITDMEELFDLKDSSIKLTDKQLQSLDISKWNVSNVKSMYSMFYKCKSFNCDLSNWNVSNVKDMQAMFYNCESFNSDLSKWDVSNVTIMHGMFYNCKLFNSDLSKWDVSKVESMCSMFNWCESFNCDLSNWDVFNVEITDNMFYGCKSLKNIPSWYKGRI